MHQAVTRIVVVPVTLVVHARPPVVAFAQVIPSGVVHKPSGVPLAVVGMCVKAPGQNIARGDSGVAVEGRIEDRSTQGVVVTGIQAQALMSAERWIQPAC